jgi:hypothetical protein
VDKSKPHSSAAFTTINDPDSGQPRIKAVFAGVDQHGHYSEVTIFWELLFAETIAEKLKQQVAYSKGDQSGQ